MMIGRTRLILGPLRDLRQLDAALVAIRGIAGVGSAAVDAFVDREAVLGLQVLRPLDLEGELRRVLGPCMASCVPGPGRLEVVLCDAGDAGRATAGADRTSSADPGAGRSGAADPGRAPDSPWDVDATGWEEPAVDAEAVVEVRRELSRRRGPDVPPAIAIRAADASTDAASVPTPAVDLVELSFVHAPVAKALISPDGRWLRVNRRLCELLGRDEADLVRRSLQEITHPDDVASDVALGRQALAGQRERYAVPKRYLRPDGRIVHARLEVSLVRDHDDRPGWFVFEVVELTGPATDRPRAALGVAAA